MVRQAEVTPVDVWEIPLDVPAVQRAAFESTLSADERERAARFRFERERRRYVVGRGALRTVLAGYREVPPGSLRFRYSVAGKPELAGADGAWLAPHFNVAHADALAVVAVAPVPVGIDLERVRAVPESAAIARRFFPMLEAERLARLPEPDRLLEFFRLWTRTEALVKLRGVALVEGAAERLEPCSALVEIVLSEPFVCALAADAGRVRVRHRGRIEPPGTKVLKRSEPQVFPAVLLGTSDSHSPGVISW